MRSRPQRNCSVETQAAMAGAVAAVWGKADASPARNPARRIRVLSSSEGRGARPSVSATSRATEPRT